MLSNKLCKELKQIASNFIPASDLDDLVQEVFIQLLSRDKIKLQSLINTGDIYRYFNRMAKLNYYSRNSRYYYTYKKEYTHIKYVNDEDIDKKIQIANDLYIIEDSDLINSILDELYWYDRELFKLYVLGDDNKASYSYTSLAKKTGISRISIYYTIRNVKKYIKIRLIELKNDI